MVTGLVTIPKKGSAKECLNYCAAVLISHTSKVIKKALQARFQPYVNRELPDVQAGFRKGRGTRDQIANICWIIEKARGFQKTSASLTMLKAFDCVNHNKLWKILFFFFFFIFKVLLNRGSEELGSFASMRDENARPPYLPPEKPVCMSGSNS